MLQCAFSKVLVFITSVYLLVVISTACILPLVTDKLMHEEWHSHGGISRACIAVAAHSMPFMFSLQAVFMSAHLYYREESSDGVVLGLATL